MYLGLKCILSVFKALGSRLLKKKIYQFTNQNNELKSLLPFEKHFNLLSKILLSKEKSNTFQNSIFFKNKVYSVKTTPYKSSKVLNVIYIGEYIDTAIDEHNAGDTSFKDCERFSVHTKEK